MAAGKRRPGESFEAYRGRLRGEEKIVSRGIAAGICLWPAKKGAYSLKKHGLLKQLEQNHG